MLGLVFLIMDNKIQYTTGQRIRSCLFIEEVASHRSLDGQIRRKALFKCECGNKFVSIIDNVKRGVATSCGCVKKKRTSKAITTHGLRRHPLYSRWKSMRQRCLDEKHASYEYYGGRGITICPEWAGGPESFIKHAETLPNHDKSWATIDRIKNDEGYKPGNIRFVDRHIQSVNQRKRKNKSGFTGVYLAGRRFTAEISVRGGKYRLGRFDSAVEAAIARDQYIINNNLKEYPLQIIYK